MKTPDDYMREMMELYSRSNSKPEPKPNPIPEPVTVPEPEPVPMPEPEPIPTPEAESDDLPQPLPLPELPEEPVLPPPQNIVQNPVSPPENETSFGWIQVTARTAGNALPLEGVSVLILKQNGMDTDLLMSLVTDSSGNTPKVRLPAPPISDERSQAYSTYEIRAFLPGYTRMESVSVPVFSGITSLQAFELIPLPVGTGDEQPAIINQNTEPKF